MTDTLNGVGQKPGQLFQVFKRNAGEEGDAELVAPQLAVGFDAVNHFLLKTWKS